MEKLTFILNRVRERLWVKPLLVCLLSIGAALLAQRADYTDLNVVAPDVSAESVETLLEVMSSSMLVIATFAVGSMVQAYASASSTVTPRSFKVVVADDVSQNALSTFVGAFIFSIVGLVAVTNGFYDRAGRFTLLAFTLVVLAIVIATFVRWVDRIARLGRMGSTIDKVEQATVKAMKLRRRMPTLRGARLCKRDRPGMPLFKHEIGYVQRVDVPALQECAGEAGARIVVAALPGTFCAPGRALAFVHAENREEDIDLGRMARAFTVGQERAFDQDPRFGLVVLSEIAARALSPAVNDPGTAIDVIGTLVRLFVFWCEPREGEGGRIGECDRVEVPELSLHDMFDDAFTSIARDGADSVEVVLRLQKAFGSLAAAGNESLRIAATEFSRRSLTLAEGGLGLPEHVELAREAAAKVPQAPRLGTGQ